MHYVFAGNVFPATFEPSIRKVCRLLWHVLGHIQRSHWEELCRNGLRAQVATVFSHFSVFCSEFSLLDSKELLLLTELAKQCRPALEEIVQEESQSLIPADTEAPVGERGDPSEANPLQDNQNWSGSFGKACAQTA